MSAMYLLVMSLAGCGVYLPQPSPETVQPGVLYNGEDHRVTIQGQRFFPMVTALSGQEPELSQRFLVSLVDPSGGRIPLSGVSWIDSEHLEATVLSGLGEGLYGVQVVGPTDQMGTLAGALEITSSRADHFELELEALVKEIGQTAWVDVQLVDRAGQPVFQPLDVSFTLTDGLEPVQVSFRDDRLQDQRDWQDGSGILGTLDESGHALVFFQVDEPGTFTIQVAPQVEPSSVLEERASMQWTPGLEVSLQLGLPSEPYAVQAGVFFDVDVRVVDQSGFLVDDREIPVFLTSACDPSIISDINHPGVLGQRTMQVRLRSATRECGQPDVIRSFLGLSGESKSIEVLAGPVSYYQVGAAQRATVGADFQAYADARDAFGNRATGGEQLWAVNSIGGVSEVECVQQGPFFCTVQHRISGSDVRLMVRDENGVEGESSVYDVWPGPPQFISVEGLTQELVAGQPQRVKISLIDAWGNPYTHAQLGETLVFTSDEEVPVCSAVDGLDDALWYDCVFHRAAQQSNLRVTLTDGSRSIEAVSASFNVVNGPLARVVIQLDSTAIVAGESVGLTGTAQDEWGNTYLRQTDSVVQLYATDVPAQPLQLDLAGIFLASYRLTTSGFTTFVIEQSGREVGRSDALRVLPAAPSTVAIEQPPWVFTGSPQPVYLSVLDPFGNTVSQSGQAYLSAQSGAFNDVGVSITSGTGVGEVQWAQTAPAEQLLARFSSVDGLGASFEVVKTCAINGPSLDVQFSGFPEPITCLDPSGQRALIVGDFGGSVAGIRPIDSQGLWIPEQQGALDLAGSPVGLTVQKSGIFDLYAVVIDDNGCAQEDHRFAYIGHDDGSVVGPLSLSMSSIQAGIGDPAIEVWVDGATTCTRDLASNASLFVRVDRADLSNVNATGRGLSLSLDATASGQLSIDLSTPSVGGPAVLSIWSEGEGTLERRPFDLSGDNQRPVVWSQDPSGFTQGTVSTIELLFSEPMLSNGVDPSRFAVSGPYGVQVVSAQLLDGGRRVQLGVDRPINADRGLWTLEISDQLRDAAQGNLLDGAYSGQASSYLGYFGNVPPTLSPLINCTLDILRFRPDGDDGLGEEADSIVIDVSADERPVYWVLEVWNSQGVQQLYRRVAASGTSVFMRWDGRDFTGRVVDNGQYRVVLYGDDGLGNRGSGCEHLVQVDNRGGNNGR